jgi:hypothetical protein
LILTHLRSLLITAQHLQALLSAKARMQNLDTNAGLLGGISGAGSRSQSAADGRGSANGGSRGSGGAGMGADHKSYDSYAPAYAEYSRDAKGAGGGGGGNYMSFESEYDE